MADLRINIDGKDNASPAFKQVGDNTKQLGEQFKSFQRFAEDSMIKGGAALLRFAKESVKASEDQAKADRQLESVAGALTDTFKEQASVLQSQLGVEDDAIQKMQTMLLRYGEAPAAVDKTIRALLDYSAVSGVDALSATQTLTSSVESGRAAFKELGLTYTKTGERSKDLEAITEALGKKVGSSAERDANSLSGQAQIATQAFKELQERFGGFLTESASKFGVLEKLTEAMRGFSTAIGGDEQYERSEKKGKLLDELNMINKALENLNTTDVKGAVSRETALARVIELRKQIAALDEEGKKSNPALPDKSEVPQDTAKKTEANKALQELAKKHAEEIRHINEEMLNDYEHYTLDNHAKMRAHIAEVAEMHTLEVRMLKEEQDQINEANFEAMKVANDRMFEPTESEQLEQEYAAAGQRIGGAFANALTGAIDQLASGGEMDAGETVGNILATILGVAGSVIGTIIAPGVGTAVGGALGALAGSGIKAATRRKRHDGGWAGERYHSGTWVGSDEEAAILQSGERVLSRPEVAAMGGQQGVDAATRGRGGGGVTVNVQTFDGSTTREFFERSGGRALLNAVRTGRGAPSLLFGGG